MPSIPNVPGVPALTSYLSSTITLLVVDAVSFLFGAPDNPWGVFLNGVQAFDYDSINSLAYKKEYSLADYPVAAETEGQASGFLSYDKVEHPFECRLRMISGGSQQAREQLLSQVEAAASTLNLYDVVTPERFYSNCNIQRFSYERTSTDGVGMMKIDITFQQIRSTEAAAFTNTQQPGSAGQQGIGNVQPTRLNGPGNIDNFPIGSVQ